MKKHVFYCLLLIAPGLVSMGLSACKKDKMDTGDINALAYPVTASPQGVSYAEWSMRWWNWIMSTPCASNPSYDPDGTFTAQNQSGPVFFLAGTSNTTAARHVTIPSGTEIFFPIFNFINDFPCPDTAFHPAAGETMEHFLKTGATQLVDRVGNLAVTLDGVNLTRPIDYRVGTNLFYFTAHPDLASCLDACITGASQPGVSDGYWVMLKSLPKGQHTLHFAAQLRSPDFFTIFSQDVTYSINVN